MSLGGRTTNSVTSYVPIINNGSTIYMPLAYNNGKDWNNPANRTIHVQMGFFGQRNTTYSSTCLNKYSDGFLYWSKYYPTVPVYTDSKFKTYGQLTFNRTVDNYGSYHMVSSTNSDLTNNFAKCYFDAFGCHVSGHPAYPSRRRPCCTIWLCIRWSCQSFSFLACT